MLTLSFERGVDNYCTKTYRKQRNYLKLQSSLPRPSFQRPKSVIVQIISFLDEIVKRGTDKNPDQIRWIQKTLKIMTLQYVEFGQIIIDGRQFP